MSAKKFSLVLLLLFTVLLSGCLGNTFGGPRLAKLVITTDTCSLKPGDSVNLAAKGFDARNKPIPLPDPKWTLSDSSKGTLAVNGAKAVFTAGADAAGTVAISVAAASQLASVELEIAKEGGLGATDDDCNLWVRPPAGEPRAFVTGLKDRYSTGDLAKDLALGDALISWQMPHGGWWKNWESKYSQKWNGRERRSDVVVNGVEAGTIDNDATVKEILFLASLYKRTGEPRFKQAVLRGIDFLLTMQYPSGGWPQIYPLRGGYSNHVTFNDDAMINVMELLEHVRKRFPPFDTDLIDATYAMRIDDALERGVRYILDSQIRVNGVLTAWCAQHDPSYPYAPRPGRSYEHVSISGSESVAIVRFLMEWDEKTPEIEAAIRAAVRWFDEVKVPDTRYVSGDPQNQYFYHQPGSTIWYRFYQIGTNKPIFSGRDGVIKHDILQIEEERRNGYSWAGAYATDLLRIAKERGYL